MEAATEKILKPAVSYIRGMEELAEQLAVRDFDLMLAGDASGNTADRPCGFACVAYDRRAGMSIVHRGGFNHGTVNMAELMPYVHALWFFVSTNKKFDVPCRVLIVSDSEVTVRQGTRQYVRNGNACFWAAIDWFEKIGFQFEWRHVYRNTNPMNAHCDEIAGQVRKQFM